MSCELTFIRLADQQIRIKLVDPRTIGESPVLYINDGDVVGTLYDENDDAVTDDIAFVYQTLSDGEWIGMLSSTAPSSPSSQFDAPVGDGYIFKIVIESDSGASYTAVRRASVVDG